MLKQAILYKDELQRKYAEAICDDHFKFYTGESYRHFKLEIDDNDWNSLQFVSVDSNNKIIGMLGAGFNRDSRNFQGFGIMNFTKKPNVTFAKDVIQFLKNIKNVHNANRIEFMAYVGSDAEAMYQKFIMKHGGRVVGTKRRCQKLIDGKYYDSTLFEILKEDMNF